MAGCGAKIMDCATWGAGVLRAYKDKKNPRTDLKIGHYKRKKEAARLIAPAAVNDVNCAGGIGRFVGREVNRQMGDFLRSADAAIGWRAMKAARAATDRHSH